MAGLADSVAAVATGATLGSKRPPEAGDKRKSKKVRHISVMAHEGAEGAAKKEDGQPLEDDRSASYVGVRGIHTPSVDRRTQMAPSRAARLAG